MPPCLQKKSDDDQERLGLAVLHALEEEDKRLTLCTLSNIYERDHEEENHDDGEAETKTAGQGMHPPRPTSGGREARSSKGREGRGGAEEDQVTEHRVHHHVRKLGGGSTEQKKGRASTSGGPARGGHRRRLAPARAHMRVRAYAILTAAARRPLPRVLKEEHNYYTQCGGWEAGRVKRKERGTTLHLRSPDLSSSSSSSPSLF